MPSTPESIAALLRENYATVAKDLVGPLVDLLVIARPAFGGDLDKLLILLVVALRTAEDPKLDVRVDDVMSGRVQAFPSLRTNVRSIADSTGVPRETVRRKMADLIAAGWIRRDGDSLSYTPEAFRALLPVREAIIEAAARMHTTVRSVEG